MSTRTSRPNVTLAVLAVGGLAFSLLQSLVAPALATLQHDLHTSESDVTWVLTGYLLSAAITTPIVGRLGDVHGKRRVLLITLWILTAGTLLAALATSLWMMLVARVLQGIGGGIFPLAFAIIRDEFPRDRVSGSIGLMSALLGLGGGLGVVLSGLIIENLSVHWLFWLPFVLIALTTVAAQALIPESPNTTRVPINWVGAGLMSVGLSAVLLAVNETTSWGWGSSKTLGLMAAGAVVLALWVWSELRSESPLVDMRMMALRGVWTTNIVGLAIGAGMWGAFVLIPQFAQTPPSEGFGFDSSVVAAGTFLLPLAVAMLIIGSVAGSLERRFGSKALVVAGAISAMTGFVLILADHDAKLPLYLATGCVGVGVGLAFAAVANIIVETVPPSQTGVATGMNTVARNLGGAFGAQIAATFLATSAAGREFPTVHGYDQAFLVALIALAISALAATLIPGRARRAPARGPVTQPETA